MRYLFPVLSFLAVLLLPGSMDRGMSHHARAEMIALASAETVSQITGSEQRRVQAGHNQLNGQFSSRAGGLRLAGFQFGASGLISIEGPGIDIAGYWQAFQNWLSDRYASQPLVAIGLVGLLVLPLLAIPGLLLRRQHRAAGLRGNGSGYGREQAFAAQSVGPVWVRIEGANGRHMRMTGEMLRIGRETDNDVCLSDLSVHRYHALIHRTPEAEFFVTDLSGENGNGILVNGVRQRVVALYSGDLIELGSIGVRFETGYS